MLFIKTLEEFILNERYETFNIVAESRYKILYKAENLYFLLEEVRTDNIWDLSFGYLNEHDIKYFYDTDFNEHFSFESTNEQLPFTITNMMCKILKDFFNNHTNVVVEIYGTFDAGETVIKDTSKRTRMYWRSIQRDFDSSNYNLELDGNTIIVGDKVEQEDLVLTEAILLPDVNLPKTSLTEQYDKNNINLYDIAKWGLEGEYSSSGCWDDADDIEDAIEIAIEDFKLFLSTPYPIELGNIPQNPIIYRLVRLKNIKDLNINNLGISWFSNPKQIENPEFFEMLDYLKPFKNENGEVYIIKGQTPKNNIDMKRTLWERSTQWWENEIVVLDDSNIKILSIESLNENIKKPKM